MDTTPSIRQKALERLLRNMDDLPIPPALGVKGDLDVPFKERVVGLQINGFGQPKTSPEKS